MMTNQFIANKIKENSFEKILLLSEQTKNLFPMKISKKNNVKKILLKIKLKSPIKGIRINKFNKKKLQEINQTKFCFDYDLENNKHNIGILNYKFVQPKNYYIHSDKLINNISNLNNTFNDKFKVLPNINAPKLRNKSLVQTHEKLGLNPKKIYLGDLSKQIETNEIKHLNNKIYDDKVISDDNKINKKRDKIRLKKLLLTRNSTNYKFESRINTEKNHRNAKLLKKFYEQKMMNYDKLIKKMEEESEIKKNVMNEYINLMKENFENNFEA